MFAIQRYIDENYKDHLFSEMLYAQGAVVGANVDCLKNYGDFGAKCIVISSIIISYSPSILPGPVIFTDVNSRVLFVLDLYPFPAFPTFTFDNISFDFWKIIDGPQLFIRANDINVNFSVAHQYLTVREKRWQDPSK